MPKEEATQPVKECVVSSHSLTLAPSWKDPSTGATYVHKDLMKVQEAWAEEQHIGPMNCTKKFGDVAGFVAYVQRYGSEATLVTWNSYGLTAILDHAGDALSPGQGNWIAQLPFTKSRQWESWRAICAGPMGQKQAVEKLEDSFEDIAQPPDGEDGPTPGTVMNVLRSLRTTANAKAEVELRPDGSTSVMFAKETQIKSTAANLDLGPFFWISIPVLKGHVDDQGRPVLYRLQVRIRASVDDNAHLTLRFSVPTADRVLEDVYADRVAAATALLGDDFPLLRAAD